MSKKLIPLVSKIYPKNDEVATVTVHAPSLGNNIAAIKEDVPHRDVFKAHAELALELMTLAGNTQEEADILQHPGITGFKEDEDEDDITIPAKKTKVPAKKVVAKPKIKDKSTPMGEESEKESPDTNSEGF